MNRKPKLTFRPDFSGRTLCITDLHGNLDLYKELLAKANYQPGIDQLILGGDLVEKGRQNLDLLHWIMRQHEEENVLAIMGNCDFVAKNVLFSYRLDFLKTILLARKNSLIHEMIAQLQLPPLDEKTDMDQLCQILRKHYLKELAFLNDLPHAIITPSKIYVHAGLQNEKTIAEDFRYCMTNFQFANTEHHYDRTVIVGHMPVSEYCKTIADFLPRLDESTNIWSLDGGNEVNEAGQLNCLILENGNAKTVSVSRLPKAVLQEDLTETEDDPFYLGFNEREVEVLAWKPESVLLYSPRRDRSFWMDAGLFNGEDGCGYTNARIQLPKGTEVELVRAGAHDALIKFDSKLYLAPIAKLDLNKQSVNPQRQN